MADISTWSPTDASNTAAVPDGWPEGQMPSSVNNCGRAMMGAVRRWYDQINAQIGTTAGTIHTTTINATTVTTTGAITAGGPITGTAINSTGNASVAGTLTAGAVSAGTVSANGYQTRAGMPGPFTGHSFNIDWPSGGTAGAHLWIDNVDLGPVATGSYLSTGGGTVGGVLTALTINTASLRDSLNQLRISFATSGGNYFNLHQAAQHSFSDTYASETFAYFNAGGSFNETGAWGVISDPGLKENIEPYSRGLAAVRQLNPVTFRYRAGTPFARESRDSLIGLMADEVAPIIPEIVGETLVKVGDEDHTVATLTPGLLVFTLINAVKELSSLVEAQATRLAALEGGTHV